MSFNSRLWLGDLEIVDTVSLEPQDSSEGRLRYNEATQSFECSIKDAEWEELECSVTPVDSSDSIVIGSEPMSGGEFRISAQDSAMGYSGGDLIIGEGPYYDPNVESPVIASGPVYDAEFEPGNFIFASEGKDVFTIHPDGTVELGENCSLDEAASCFWEAVMRMNPIALQTRVNQLENMMRLYDARNKRSFTINAQD